jgi:hypothetical protein
MMIVDSTILGLVSTKKREYWKDLMAYLQRLLSKA